MHRPISSELENNVPGFKEVEAVVTSASLRDVRLYAVRSTALKVPLPARDGALFFVECGTGSARFDGTEVPLRTGSWLALRTVDSVAFCAKRNVEMHCYCAVMHIPEKQQSSALWPLGTRFATAHPVDPAGAVAVDRTASYFEFLMHEYSRRDALREQTLQQILQLILVHFYRLTALAEYCVPEVPLDPTVPEPVRRVCRFVHLHLYDDIRSRDLATHAKYSTRRLADLFRKSMSCTPMAYLRRVRVREAKRLLAGRRYSVKEIAARLHFSDVHHFSRTFKKATGTSPTGFLEQRSTCAHGNRDVWDEGGR